MYLEGPQNTYITWAKIIWHKPLFYNKILKILCNVLNIVLKVKNRMIIWVQNCCKCIDCLLSRSGFPGGSAGKESCNAADLGSVPGLGRSPGEGKGCPLQYSDLENSTDYIVHRVRKSRTLLSDFPFPFYPQDRMAARELSHHQRASDCISLAQKKYSSTEFIAFHTLVKSKNHKSRIICSH